ncbi:hypothetical protein CsatB_024541 [Cannabis sativa]|uniref:Homeobox-leucine zipper protein n=2 Tax=Cannabis sativa TaxID=3483 RepID=A0A7J6GCE4_CANSA|nr:homeobox-leucine zipper protein ATHB-40 [Cannabis sativa]KAF4380635.1 hypothetical protein F8388_016989 [Cannabis sativa]KAF4393235.1 hypothetical protein G4B88_001969 [Cannabis sativa]
MNNTNNNQVEDHMVLYTQLYPGVYPQMVPQQGETKTKRRRKKSKSAKEESALARKRKLSDEQVNLLEMNFGSEHKLESERKDRLAAELGLDPRQVAVWFQNRRARWKNKKLEQEYSNLKKIHDSVVHDKCCLESEVLKLKEQLSNAEMKIQRLTERVECVSSNSPSSSMSMEAVMDPPFLGEFGVVEEYDDVFYVPDDNNPYINNGMEWMNLYM